MVKKNMAMTWIKTSRWFSCNFQEDATNKKRHLPRTSLQLTASAPMIKRIPKRNAVTCITYCSHWNGLVVVVIFVSGIMKWHTTKAHEYNNNSSTPTPKLVHRNGSRQQQRSSQKSHIFGVVGVGGSKVPEDKSVCTVLKCVVDDNFCPRRRLHTRRSTILIILFYFKV